MKALDAGVKWAEGKGKEACANAELVRAEFLEKIAGIEQETERLIQQREQTEHDRGIDLRKQLQSEAEAQARMHLELIDKQVAVIERIVASIARLAELGGKVDIKLLKGPISTLHKALKASPLVPEIPPKLKGKFRRVKGYVQPPKLLAADVEATVTPPAAEEGAD